MYLFIYVFIHLVYVARRVWLISCRGTSCYWLRLRMPRRRLWRWQTTRK